MFSLTPGWSPSTGCASEFRTLFRGVRWTAGSPSLHSPLLYLSSQSAQTLERILVMVYPSAQIHLKKMHLASGIERASAAHSGEANSIPDGSRTGIRAAPEHFSQCASADLLIYERLVGWSGDGAAARMARPKF
jgi:hypothetical protein